MNDSFAVAIVLFWFGIFALTTFLRDRKMLAGRLRKIEEALRDANALTVRRAERLPDFLKEARCHDELRIPHDDARNALQVRNNLPANARPEARIAAEQELSRVVLWLCDEAEDAGLLLPKSDKKFADALHETRDREAQFADAREKYNEAADAWNAYRRLFPLGILARAITPAAAPLY